MFAKRFFVRCPLQCLALLLLGVAGSVWAGVITTTATRAVGGVLVDAQGVLTNAEVDDLGELRRIRQETMKDIPADLKRPSKLRKVSLRGLEAAIAQRKQNGEADILLDEMHYMAGLTRIQYVLVYPEQNDIVLAGPAEGWKVDEKGTVVGASTGLPIVQLDHLLVALRTAEAAAHSPISCSIDPTPEGMRRFQAFMRTQKQFTPAVLTGIEQALGMQTITVNGVSDSTDFARILVAADFRMKRLGMGFEKSPVRGMPSYLEMVTASGAQSAMPRWWMAPNYDALLRDPEGLAWQLRGPGVKCMTEDSLFAADGTRQVTGKTSAAAQKWADLMTEHYEELCVAEPIFGELRNIMDLAVVAALIVKEQLRERAEYDMPLLMNPREIVVDGFPAPKQVNSKASALKKGRSWIISASGGVEINSWQVVSKSETDATLGQVRQPKPADARHWYWD